MFVPGIEMQMRRGMEMLLAAEGVSATLLWRTVVRPEGYDKNDEDSAAGALVTKHKMTFNVLFHQVEHRLSGFQRFIEIETGDVIIDYLADLALEGKEDVRVLVNGHLYAQKTASSKLLETWDTVMAHGGLMRSVLLTPLGPQEVVPEGAVLEQGGEPVMSGDDEFVIS